jgi:hypothetical protein
VNSRQRFRETMHYGAPDRVPCFEEGIRDGVLDIWRQQGLAPDVDLCEMFSYDRHEEMSLDLGPRPRFERWPNSSSDLDELRSRFNAADAGRLPENWPDRVRAWHVRDHVLMLPVHVGFFQALGVDGWTRFREVIYLLKDEPAFIRDALAIVGQFAADLAARLLAEVEVDAAIFSEPIGGNDRALLSPKDYESFVLPSYQPILDVLRQHGVETIIMRTYANARVLVPSMLKWGVNCLWACEVDVEAMDYHDLRREFGRDLRLIGGIDLDLLHQDQETIRSEIEGKAPLLLKQGGYIPLADGRVRPDVPFAQYVYYRQILERVASSTGPDDGR